MDENTIVAEPVLHPAVIFSNVSSGNLLRQDLKLLILSNIKFGYLKKERNVLITISQFDRRNGDSTNLITG